MDKVWWADETDEPEFRDDRTGTPLDPVKVPAGREEELKKFERLVCVEADLEEHIRVAGKKPTGRGQGLRSPQEQAGGEGR